MNKALAFGLCRVIVQGSGGAWGLDAEDVVKVIIKSATSLGGGTVSTIANQIYQSLSITLHKANESPKLSNLFEFI